MNRKMNAFRRTLIMVLGMLTLLSCAPLLGGAAFSAGGATPLAASLTPLANGDTAYLETDIMSSSRTNVNMYPDSGTFYMSGLTYTRGIVNNNTQEGMNNDGTATYRITGTGYMRLSGEFGRVSGTGGATLTVTGDGKLLGGFQLFPEDLPKWLDIAIPAGVQDVGIRLQNGSGGIFALADAYFAVGGPTQPNPQPPATADATYLENDLISTQRSNVNSHPVHGSFLMNGITYFRGLVNNNALNGSGFDGTATYRITGRGYTRLTGEFGRVSGSGSATLTITGDGKLLGGYILGENDDALQVDVGLPSGLQDVSIRLQNGSNGLFALADAYFTATGQPPPHTHPPATADAAYLENDLISAQRTNVDRYPMSGSYQMEGKTFFRGIVNNSLLTGNNFDGTATYRIEGRGFTRLSGIFGRVSGNGGATITITADNVELGAFQLSPGETQRQLDVSIPPGARNVHIRLQNGSSGLFALADAYFTGSGEAPPTQGFTVTPIASPPGGGSVTGGGTFQQGNTATVTASPNAGWVFTGWFENGIRVSTDFMWSFAVTANRALEARFGRRNIENPHSSWATEGLVRASELNLIPESLAPASVDYTRPINRVEFAGIAVRTYERLTNTTVSPPVNNPFIDTWDLDALKAFNAGIMVGSGNEFQPFEILTREMAAQALTRVYKRATIPGWTFATDADYPLHFTSPPPFDDDMYINYWTREGVYFMAANGVIQGIGDNLFAPRPVTNDHIARGYGTAAREHAIILALNLINKLG